MGQKDFSVKNPIAEMRKRSATSSQITPTDLGIVELMPSMLVR
jgi:hypothetical protein